MKNLNSPILEESFKRNKKFLIVSLVFLMISSILLYFGLENAKKELPTPVSMSDLIEEAKSPNETYAYIDVNTKPYLFAVYETDGIKEENKFYLVMDKDNYLYIVYMGNNNFAKLNLETIKEKPIRIYGLTKKIPNDIKDLAISSYNELMKDEYLTVENFKDYVGLIYLDLETSLNDSTLYYTFAIISIVFFITFLIVYLINHLKSRNTLKKYSFEELNRLSMELMEISNNKYSKMKLYFTKNYIVDTSLSLVILKYEEIIWAYPYEHRSNGLLVNKNIKVITSLNKTYDIANTNLINKNKEETLKDILNFLKNKNSNLIIGFTKENKKIIKEKVRKNKGN